MPPLQQVFVVARAQKVWPQAQALVEKSTYIIAPITPQCAPDMEYDAGLCYKKCREQEGYYGVGPVCWKRCPMGMEDCGAMCGKTKMDCAKAIGEQI